MMRLLPLTCYICTATVQRLCCRPSSPADARPPEASTVGRRAPAARRGSSRPVAIGRPSPSERPERLYPVRGGCEPAANLYGGRHAALVPTSAVALRILRRSEIPGRTVPP